MKIIFHWWKTTAERSTGSRFRKAFHSSNSEPAAPPGAFAKGQLTGITRQGQTVAYAYDRFGRLVQDGALSYGYDKNGNRNTINYPNGAVAIYSHDFADREQSLAVQIGANPPLQLVSGAAYKPFGPLSSLSLGNGLTETRSFNSRYFPAAIQVPGLLHWTYATDPAGNITAITDNLNAANNRTYGYQDPQYFLTSGNGPWGTRSWSYDRIGNRLTETRGTTTDTYDYLSNATGGNTPQIDQIVRFTGPSELYSYDEAGNVLNGALSFSYGDDRRMSQSETSGGAVTTYVYDGRGFLSQSVSTLSGPCTPTTPFRPTARPACCSTASLTKAFSLTL